MTCTASHTITQADIDAGSYYNQACVDDGAAGAAQACDDETTTGEKNPHLSITKDATESGYNTVGQVIHYTIVATNDGNTTLAAVTVTDPNATGLTCTPANGSSLAPGGTMTCSASHTITQADIDAGSYFNQACVDDGTAGAVQACDDVTTPGTQNPHLSITKSASPTTYSVVGQVITYTIVATNDGNVTLSNVTVSDPSVSNLTCTPSNPVASLAPGGTINCSATHTITQADLDAGHYTNTACVDDGTGGAAQACAPSTVNKQQTAQIAPTATTCANFRDGTAADLTELLYTVKSGKINSVAPGVLFYYSFVTVSSTGNVTVTQSDSSSLTPPFTIPNGQANLYNLQCTKVKTGTVSGNGALATFSSVAPGTYIIGIKYDPTSVKGSNDPGTVTYSFVTAVGGTTINSTLDTIQLKKKV
jgi:uncharacterized repeat protein (TIGR01451 family)